MSATVHISIQGILIVPDGKSKDFMETIPDSCTVKDLLFQIGYKKAQLSRIMVSVDGKLKHLDDQISNGDSVLLSMHLGGG